MSKNRPYEALKKVTKDRYINDFIKKYENFTNTIFLYEGLPETLKSDYIEKIMYYDGSGVFAHIPEGQNIDGTVHQEGLYFFRPNYSGVKNEVDEPTLQVNINTYLMYNKITPLKDCVKMKNNSSMLPTVNTVNKYAVYMYDNELSLNMYIVLSRIPYIISASDDNTRSSALEFIQSIINGDYKIIGESAFLEGIKLNPTPSNSNTPTNYIETLQYYKASLMHELGVNANYNMKRESLNDSEIEVNIDSLKPIINDMYNHRLKAVRELNEKYDLKIKVSLNEPWNFGITETNEDVKEI